MHHPSSPVDLLPEPSPARSPRATGRRDDVRLRAAARDNTFVRVRGAREHNLKDVNLDIPRDALVVFTGVSGSGKSSLAFGTLFAEAQRRYLESVAPYARRLFEQQGVPEVDSIDGLPPAVALQQQRGSPTSRSSVGSVTTISNLLRMLYSRAGRYPRGQGIIYAEGFSPNTPEGACPRCHGLGRVYEVTEHSMVPDPSLTIRERAVAAWPTAWQGQNLRDILTTLGIDVDVPWRELPKKTRDWILFTEEQPQVPVFAGYTIEEVKRAIRRKEEPDYMGTFTSAKRHVMHTFANSQSASMKRRAAEYMVGSECPTCHGKRLKREALAVKFADLDIAEMSRLPLSRLARLFRPIARGEGAEIARLEEHHPEQAVAATRIAEDLCSRLDVLLDLGLGYLGLERSTPTLSPGELQRLRLATQVRSNLFGVVYVLDEPSAGLHPADTEALLRALDGLKASGNSLFVVEHNLDVAFPLGVFTTVTGVSGSGKSSLVSQALVELVGAQLGHEIEEEGEEDEHEGDAPSTSGRIVAGMERVKRLVRVDQKPIGRTPRSNLATYTGLFDHVRRIFAATKEARSRRYDVGRFSFNVAKGRCENCEGEGFVCVELLFLPSVYAPCPVCHGTRYNAKTLEIEYQGKSIADVLAMTVDAAWEFFADEPHVHRALTVLREVGVGYLRLGQPATELSGGEAQRIKLATELQRVSRGTTLYVLDEPTTGLHPSDVEKLMAQLHGLVDAGNTVIVVDHHMRVVAGSDRVMDIGPGAGEEGGRLVAFGTPTEVAEAREGRTAGYLAAYLRSM